MSASYGLIGFPLTHSFSPAYFKKKFTALHSDATYEAFTLPDIAQFPALLEQHTGLVGLNVTIPYKETIIPYLDEVDNMAYEIGAVNCVVIHNGFKKGYNTDAEGFEQSLVPLLRPYHTHALVLGTGGASKAVAYVLKELGIAFQKVSTSGEPGALAYGDLTGDIIASHKIIINTTPVGMYPHHADSAPPLPYESVGAQHLLYDLIYNPEETKFLAQGIARGATIKNGYEMLHVQADASWRIWNRAMANP